MHRLGQRTTCLAAAAYLCLFATAAAAQTPPTVLWSAAASGPFGAFGEDVAIGTDGHPVVTGVVSIDPATDDLTCAPPSTTRRPAR